MFTDQLDLEYRVLLTFFDIAYDSEEAKNINKLIFETIYFGALEASNELAKEKGVYSLLKDHHCLKENFSLICGIQNLQRCGIGKH